MKATSSCVILFFAIHTLGFTQTDSSARVLLCQDILAKNTLAEEDFQQLDSVLFLINYYASETPIALYHRAIRRADQSVDEKKFAGIFELRLADLYWEFDNLDSAAHYINSAATRFKSLNDELAYARTANVRRLLKAAERDFLAGHDLCFEALKIFKKYDDKAGIGVTYRDIASIMIHEEKYEDAVAYCSKSIAALESIDFWYELNFSYQRMAIIYRNLGDFKKAHTFLQKAIDACYHLEGFRVIQGISKLYWTRGYIYEAEGKFDQAIAQLDSSVFFANQINFSFDRWIFDSKGRIYLQQQKYQEALNEFQQELDLLTNGAFVSKGYAYYNFYLPVYSNLAAAYEGLQQYEQAYTLAKKIATAKDSTFTLESEKQISELRTQYETEQKEATILAQEKLLAQQNIIQWFIIGFAGILGLFLFQAYRNAQLRKRANEALLSANAQLELKNQENELLLKEIHHRVKNNLQTISSLLSLQSESIQDQSAWDAVQESKNRVNSMALLHQKLYQGENLAAIEMRDYFETIGKTIIESFGEKAEHVSLQVEMPELELDVDTAVPIGLITNELVTNSLKYAFPGRGKGQILIKLTADDDDLLKLHISDNGRGNADEQAPQDGGGFGTLLVQLLTTQLGGQLEKSTEAGTAITIRFPRQEKSAA